MKLHVASPTQYFHSWLLSRNCTCYSHVVLLVFSNAYFTVRYLFDSGKVDEIFNLTHNINIISIICLILMTLLSMQVPVYGAAILVVRNPYRAFIAEWNRLYSKAHALNVTGGNVHVSVLGEENFSKHLLHS